jgi:hypothetical protein
MTLVLDDKRFIPFGILIALASMTIIVVGRIAMLAKPQLMA